MPGVAGPQVEVATGKSRVLTDLADTDLIQSFDVAPDGQAFDRRRENADIRADGAACQVAEGVPFGGSSK